jgi:hypothetical protein
MHQSLFANSFSCLVLCLFVAACGSETGGARQVPTTPTTTPEPGGGGSPTLTAPRPLSPIGGEQLSTLRPTLTVENGSSTGQGEKTYEFQISDRSDFSLGAALTASFLVAVNRTGVAEGSGGRTTLGVDQDLQPTTRMYWRSRLVQGTATSAWSEPAMFRTKLVGYSRPGELYDPLIHGETIGTVVGSHVWIPGKGLQLDTQNSFVRYQLAESMSSGEFSVEVEGLHPNGPAHKLKIFSMSDTTGDTTDSRFQMSTMYRGITGNPDNCIAFKAVFGSQSRIVEPDLATRRAGVRFLDPSKTYFWKATWGSEFRLLVLDGGVNGSSVYELGLPASGSYNPSPAYAYLGTNQSVFGSDAGTFPGATYRHLFIGNRPRPATLGNALD